MIEADDVGGVHIKYLYHCPRQLWLYLRGVRPEHLSGTVQLGEAVHETSYNRNSPIDLGAAKLDFIDGQHWVHEVKSSARPTRADEAQGRHYCYRLEQIGIDAQGAILHYPKTAAPIATPTRQKPAEKRKPTSPKSSPSPAPGPRPPAWHAPPAEAAASPTTAGRNDMPAAARTYWLTSPCRIRRKDESLVIEREATGKVHIPVTDVRDIVACAETDINTSVVALLNRHLLSHYGDYVGSLLTSDTSTSGETVLAQARLAENPEAALQIARSIVGSTAFNVRRVIDRKLLARPYDVLQKSLETADNSAHLMGIEGTFRRSAWEVLDTKLPGWLQLGGRSRRPPKNAGDAFISYVNGIMYARTLTALRLTPLHTGIAFLHSSMERQRHSLVLDLSEMFKPLFAERLLLRMATRNQLKEHHFDSGANQAMLSESGRKLVVQAVRDELAITVAHRALGRPVAYDELLYLDALALTRRCLEGTPYKPFCIWW